MIGKVVGNYRVTAKLGEGGMGVVYLAEHPVIGKKVALKVLHTELARNAEVISRFFNEARAVNLIGHPNIVDVIDLGHTEDGAPYFTMEFLEGESLADRIRREGKLSIPVAVMVADQTLDALAAAHGKGIIHRDMKPENVFLVRRGARVMVKVLDFGIAKLQDQAGAMHKTQTGSVMGTPLYMSAEQCRGAGAVDHRSDIYSFGIVLYEMLTGRPTFVGEGFADLLRQHLMERPTPVRTYREEVPPELDAAILRALEKEPSARFVTAGEFRDAVLMGAGDAAPTSPLLPTLNAVATAPVRVGAGTVQGIARTAMGTGPSPTMGPNPHAAANITTLSATAGEAGLDDIDDEIAGMRAGRGKKLAVLGLLAAAGAAAVFVMQKQKVGASVDSAVSAAAALVPAPPVAPAAATAAAPVPAAPAAPAVKPTAAVERVKILIETDPPKAKVLVAGKKVGETPYTLEIPKGEARKIELVKTGMKTVKRALVGDRDRTESFTLEERAAAADAPGFDPEGDIRPPWMK